MPALLVHAHCPQLVQGDHKGFLVCRKKMATSSTNLSLGVAEPFRRFTEDVVNLKFDEEPAYAAYTALFQPLLGAQRVSECTKTCRMHVQCRVQYVYNTCAFTGTAPSRPITLEDATPRVGQKRSRAEEPTEDDPASRKRIRNGYPATQWITIYNKMPSMKQRYHYNVSSNRLEFHVNKGLADGLYISSVACCGDCGPSSWMPGPTTPRKRGWWSQSFCPRSGSCSSGTSGSTSPPWRGRPTGMRWWSCPRGQSTRSNCTRCVDGVFARASRVGIVPAVCRHSWFECQLPCR